VQDDNTVTITANRAYTDRPGNPAKNVPDIGANSVFSSANEPSQTISFNFGNLTAAAAHDSLCAQSSAQNGNHLKSWVLEGSPDGNSWIELDRRKNNFDVDRTYGSLTSLDRLTYNSGNKLNSAL
jgi:hypothetical protein